jgi:hypothetical protein
MRALGKGETLAVRTFWGLFHTEEVRYRCGRGGGCGGGKREVDAYGPGLSMATLSGVSSFRNFHCWLAHAKMSSLW